MGFKNVLMLNFCSVCIGEYCLTFFLESVNIHPMEIYKKINYVLYLLSRVVPISDEESLSFLQSQSEQDFFEDLTRGDSLVSNNNFYLECEQYSSPAQA